jgi:hypothetical protein
MYLFAFSRRRCGCRRWSEGVYSAGILITRHVFLFILPFYLQHQNLFNHHTFSSCCVLCLFLLLSALTMSTPFIMAKVLVVYCSSVYLKTCISGELYLLPIHIKGLIHIFIYASCVSLFLARPKFGC